MARTTRTRARRRTTARRRRTVPDGPVFPAFGLLHEFMLAAPRIRLARVLNWLGKDLAAPEAPHLDVTTFDGRVFSSHLLRAIMPGGWRVTFPTEPMPEPVLRTLQADLRKGVASLLRGEPWRLPTPSGAQCVRTAEGVGIAWEGDEVSAVPHGLAQLVAAHASHVRACRECGRLFLAVKRQQYDTEACGHAYRNRGKQRRRAAPRTTSTRATRARKEPRS